MDKAELQAQILNNHKSSLRLTSAIHKLPESETRGELIYKYNKILQRLNELHVNLEKVDKTCCYFGFTDKCPGVPCMECQFYEN